MPALAELQPRGPALSDRPVALRFVPAGQAGPESGSKPGSDPRPLLNRWRWPQPWNRVRLLLAELVLLVVRISAGAVCPDATTPPPAPGRLVCGNSLQAKKSVNLKKKSFLSPSEPPTALGPCPIVLCFLSCLLIF